MCGDAVANRPVGSYDCGRQAERILCTQIVKRLAREFEGDWRHIRRLTMTNVMSSTWRTVAALGFPGIEDGGHDLGGGFVGGGPSAGARGLPARYDATH